ncbi:MAG: hypothetical protein ACFB4J_08325 [Elainellaceae cyanobacterium]
MNQYPLGRVNLAPCLCAGLAAVAMFTGCGRQANGGDRSPLSQTSSPNAVPTDVTHNQEPSVPQPRSSNASNTSPEAAVEGVSVSGEPGQYQLSVTVRSSETGCDQYADWWEVVDASGQLLYRRILAHSHVDEQPFTRSGGPVPLSPGQKVIVRVHMNPSGYSPQAYQGQVSSDGSAQFEAVTLAPSFAAELAQQPPLPSGCAF